MVSVGYTHACAIQTDGHLMCFGSNKFGESDVPSRLGPVLAVSAGNRHTCAVCLDGELVCFGEADYFAPEGLQAHIQ